MKLFDRTGFPNPARIRIVLAEKNLESRIEFASIDLIGAEHKQQEFLTKNPSGVLPVLQLDDGTYISECTAITEYLDNLDGDPRLTGRTPREKAVIHMMQRRAEAELLDAVGNYFHYATPGLGADLQAFKSLDWEGRSEWGRREGDRARRGMASFDALLTQRPYVAGDAFSMADITLFVGLMFADAAGLPLPAEYAALAAWRATVAERPSVKHRSGQKFAPEDLRRMGFDA